ncbi:MAG: hypothetical protein HUJ55_06880 [Ileibacterium sp.]|nr:hypothetical protein [Ileibacterium sp.]
MSEENKALTPDQTAMESEAAKAADSTPAAETEQAEIDAGTAVQEEESAADAPTDAEKVKAAAIDEMEKASQKALEAMREEDNSESDEIVDEAKAEVESMFEKLRTRLEKDVDPEKIKAELLKVSQDVNKVLGTTKEKVIDVANSEQFKNTMAAGKDFVSGTGAMIVDGLKYGYDKLMEVPQFKQAAGKVDDSIGNLRKSDKLKDMVGAAEKGVSEFNKGLFKTLNSFFDAAPKEANAAESTPAQAASEEEK